MSGSDQEIDKLAKLLGVNPQLIEQALVMSRTGAGYRKWQIAKSNGGERTIAKALWPLSEVQARLATLIYPYSVSSISYGFVYGRSPLMAVLPHFFAKAIFCVDISNAFPSVEKRLVEKSFYLQEIFSASVAHLAAEICCPLEKESGRFSLPLGQISSPYIFNLIFRPIDKVLEKFAQKRDLQISRYVDNLALSTKKKAIPQDDRNLFIQIIYALSYRAFKIPSGKTSYYQYKKDKSSFGFLGLKVEEVEGLRRIGIVDKKLSDITWELLEALKQGDFSSKTERHLRGKMTYLKHIYGDSIPEKIALLWQEYEQRKQVFWVSQAGQLPLIY